MRSGIDFNDLVLPPHQKLVKGQTATAKFFGVGVYNLLGAFIVSTGLENVFTAP